MEQPPIPPAAFPHFLAPVPRDLQEEIDRRNAIGSRLVLLGRYPEAFEVYRYLYELMLGRQPEGRRFHKGLPLHNMGWALLRAGVDDQGAEWTAKAFIEDSLSRAEESPAVFDELSRPAAQNLRLLGAPETDLYGLSTEIRQHAWAGQLVQDPVVLFLRFDLPRRILAWLRHAIGTLRIRVFVSSPVDLRNERRIVAEICRQLTSTLPAHVEALLWEGGGERNPNAQPFPPEITGAGAQGVIDDHLWNRLGGYNVYFGMLWRRMGTPVGTWRSGTEAEFRYAFERRRRGEQPEHVLFYEKLARPRATRDPAAADFLAELRTMGLVNRFGAGEDLRRAAFDQLAAIVREALGQR